MIDTGNVKYLDELLDAKRIQKVADELKEIKDNVRLGRQTPASARIDLEEYEAKINKALETLESVFGDETRIQEDMEDEWQEIRKRIGLFVDDEEKERWECCRKEIFGDETLPPDFFEKMKMAYLSILEEWEEYHKKNTDGLDDIFGLPQSIKDEWQDFFTVFFEKHALTKEQQKILENYYGRYIETETLGEILNSEWCELNINGYMQLDILTHNSLKNQSKITYAKMDWEEALDFLHDEVLPRVEAQAKTDGTPKDTAAPQYLKELADKAKIKSADNPIVQTSLDDVAIYMRNNLKLALKADVLKVFKNKQGKQYSDISIRQAITAAYDTLRK